MHHYDHPLDPLNAAEIEQAVAIVRAHAGLDASAWFETVTLDEPDKAYVRGFAPGDPPRRKAFVCCYEPASNRTFDGVVDLAGGRLERWRHVPGAQARIVVDEFLEGERIAKADPAFRAACAKRGITDMDLVLVEPWAAGNFGIANEAGQRIAYGNCWARSGDNPYARPIANLHPVIDLRAGKLLRIDDWGVVPLPPEASTIGGRPLRTGLKPLEIVQPEGPSFSVEGRLVRWQNWRFRVGFAVRDGLVLYDIAYEDGDRVRPIMYRASLAEMVVPYGDPTGSHHRKNAFDTGEYGIGQLLDSLALGCDCLGHIHYFDAWAHDWHGQPRRIANAICLHEEDYGILWKFTDGARGQTAVRRSRRLVISTLATIGNYVYGFYWYFYQDGTIGVEIKATGIPLATARAPGEPAAYGQLVAPQVDALIHQHIFCFRFDMAIDGDRNAVTEVNFAPLPMDDANPHGNAIRVTETPLKSEQAAQRVMDTSAARYWKVVNPGKRNRLGQPVAYKLVPGTNALPFLHPDSPVGRRAAFIFKHFWATRYAPDELYPTGWYPNQHAGGDGLPRWTAADRPLDNENLVVWYTLNYHHLPRPEDWPVQPVVYAGFHWMPVGFFEANPALDVPPPVSKSHCG
ncbi:MAG: primary-amine oxidase [Rhodospirillaceae bacterium]|nr:primary-amine oxidase [Rhodospirillaceae bacterium]